MTEGLRTKALYGVVHLAPMPGTPFHTPGSLATTIDEAVRDARALEAGGATGILLQTADRVYPVDDNADPARVAAVTRVVDAVIAATGEGWQVGVQIMRHAVRASLAVAKVTGCSFVRADALVGITTSTHGVVQPDSAAIMAYRRALDAFDVELIVDIDSMHYTWLGSLEPTAGVARRALQVGADSVCIAHRDQASARRLVAETRAECPRARIIIGGFVTHDNAAGLLQEADGAFVSGCIARSDGAVDVAAVRALVSAIGSR